MNPELKKIAKHLREQGGKCYLVGGAVRDLILGRESKDLDIEVFGMDSDVLAKALKPFGKVQADVGKSFSVIKLYTKQDHYDFSLPRRERKVAPGHKGFVIEADPTMTPEEAAMRRDFTFNALMMDLETDEVLDFFGGQEDLKCGILRHIGPAFAEDPLRVLRGFQFCGRFNLRAERVTAKLCQRLIGEYHTFPVERIWTEWHKWALKSTKPSAGLQFLFDCGWSLLYADMAFHKLFGTPQDPEWHPEGDVLEHTKHVVDAAVEIADRENIQGYDRVMYVLAAFCHDLGKPATTVFERERWRSPAHAKVGESIAANFLEQIGAPKKIAVKIPPIVAEHLCHIDIENANSLKKQVRKLSTRLEPASIKELCWVIEADCSGRPPKPKRLPPGACIMKEMAIEDGVFLGTPKPIVTGRMLLATGWIQPGKAMGLALKEAYKDQLKCKINTKDDAVTWIRNRFYRPIVTGQFLIDRKMMEPGPLMGDLLKEAHIAQEKSKFDDEDGAVQWVNDWLSEL